MHTMKCKYNLLTCKNYFKKIYESVDWNFLKVTLSEFSFPPKIINFIMSCTISSSLSLKLNNEQLDKFIQSHWLRQGDPMIP